VTPVYAALIVAVIALQTFWIGRAIGKVEDGVDGVDSRLEAFRAENHRDMQLHTEAITDLRERVARLERT
jgi:hypothetical protein